MLKGQQISSEKLFKVLSNPFYIMYLFSIFYFLDTYSILIFNKPIFVVSENFTHYLDFKNITICLFSASIFYALLLPITKDLLEILISNIRFKLMSDKKLKEFLKRSVKDYIYNGEYRLKAIKLNNNLAYDDYKNLKKELDNLNNFEYASYSIFIFYVIRVILFYAISQDIPIEASYLFFFDNLQYELMIFLNIPLFISILMIIFPNAVQCNRNIHLKQAKKSFDEI